MKEYDVKITETLEKTVTVQAESHDAAEEQVRAAYYNSEYILDSENFTGVAFGTTEEREVQKEQADTMNVLLVKPFMYPQAVQIGCELEDLQKAVGGDIEASDDRSILAQRLNISPHQLSYVTNSGEGEGLLFYGNVILPFIDRFPTDLELYRIMTTKLNEVAQEKEA